MNQHPYYNTNPHGFPLQQPAAPAAPVYPDLQLSTNYPYSALPYQEPLNPSPGYPSNPGSYPFPQFPYQPNVEPSLAPGHVKDFCKKHKDFYVLLEMNDGQQYDGIVDKVDDENVYMLIPDGDHHQDREFSFGGYDDDYGYGGYGSGYGQGYGGYGRRYPRRFRRFRRYRFPLRRLIRAILYPYFY
ncbi:hypothetical protein ACFSCX_24655 [Bacillus salitolerans]|uniref:Spore coat protein n=1 Tax=Bacillus salitolerans TaxID=1437434 RepID=A0ABW4LXT8_9BACI